MIIRKGEGGDGSMRAMREIFRTIVLKIAQKEEQLERLKHSYVSDDILKTGCI